MKRNENYSTMSQSMTKRRKKKSSIVRCSNIGNEKFLFEYFYLTERLFEVFAPKMHLFLIRVKGEKRRNQHRYKKKLFVHQHQLR